jgi:integrase/recombinase XerD
LSTTLESLDLIRQEDMRHPHYVWTDPGFAEEPLRKLQREWEVHLKGRSKTTSPDTRRKYVHDALESFIRSLERHGEAAVLGSVTPYTVNRWISELREAGQSEWGNAGRLSAVKIFANNYIFKHLELTNVDLLRKVPRIEPPERDAEVFSRDELEKLVAAYQGPRFEDRRNAAVLEMLIATGCRLKEVMDLRFSDYDPVATEITVVGKGDEVRYCKLSSRALKALRAYLKVRPTGISDRLWLTAEGEPLGKWGVQSIMRRAKKRSGIQRFHAHLLRHTFGNNAIDAGAPPAVVQDMLGHKTDMMSKHYSRAARRRAASRAVAQYAPLG